MGFSPRDVDACTFWEFAAAADGYRRAHSPDDGPKSPTPEEHDALVAKYG